MRLYCVKAQTRKGNNVELYVWVRGKNIWFYDAWVDLYADVDNDGYYSGIDLTFDADTIYSVAEVYAVVYLSYELGPWNEYAVTEDFTILGSSGTDEYFIETDLVAGYPTGDYDILIELFDTFDNAFVAMHFGRRQVHFVGVVIARLDNTRQDVAHLGFIVNEAQQ